MADTFGRGALGQTPSARVAGRVPFRIVYEPVLYVIVFGPAVVVVIVGVVWFAWGRRRWIVWWTAGRLRGQKLPPGPRWIDVAMAVAAVGSVLWAVGIVWFGGSAAPRGP